MCFWHVQASVATDLGDRDILLATLNVRQVGRLFSAIGRAADIDAVVTGEAIEPSVWERMHPTVLRYVTVNGLGMFVPVSQSEPS